MIHTIKELYGCKFVINHMLIRGDADDYLDKPIRSLDLTWDGIELCKTDDLEDDWEEDEDEVSSDASDEKIFANDKELDEYIKRIQNIQSENERMQAKANEEDAKIKSDVYWIAFFIGVAMVIGFMLIGLKIYHTIFG